MKRPKPRWASPYHTCGGCGKNIQVYYPVGINRLCRDCYVDQLPPEEDDES